MNINHNILFSILKKLIVKQKKSWQWKNDVLWLAINSYYGHFIHANSFNLRKDIFQNHLGKLKTCFHQKRNFSSLKIARFCLSLFFSFILLSLVLTGRAYAATYYTSGTLTSTDLLSQQSQKSIDTFGYNASSIPASTNLKVQFSNDGTTWKNSSGVTDGWDTLSEGDHTATASAINLSGLNWRDVNHFYYKMQLETSDTAATPVLDDIILYYTQGNNFTSQYYTSGTLASTNLLSGQSVTNINIFAYNLSALPAGTGATIQFSQNATDWYNSSGALNGTNTLNSGSNSINLAPLNWSGANFYYKIQFTGDGSSTPVLDDITVTINNAVVTVPNADSIDLDRRLAGGFTIDTWVKVASSAAEEANGQIFNKGTNTWLRVTNKGPDGKADLEASLDLATTDATVTITDGIDINKWTHITVGYTDDGDDEITIYINGTNPGTSTNGSGAPAADTNDLLIGGTTGAHFHGFIDEFKIFPFERTASQVKTSTASKIPSVHGISASFGDDQSYLSNGLVGYWKMDDGVNNPCVSGVDKACDSSGNGNIGTWTNGVASTSGKFGNAASFDGANDYIDAGSGASLNVTDAITLSAWINVGGNGSGTDGASGFISKDSQWGYCGYTGKSGWGEMSYTPTSRYFGVSRASDGLKICVNYSVSLNQWQHIVMTAQANDTVKVYVDGVKVGESTQTLTGGISNYNTSLKIGVHNAINWYFNGKIDDVHLYNHALSPTEVQSLYDWAPGPVGWWKLDENTGAAANDSSGLGNTGTLTNSPSWTRGKFGSALSFDGSDDYVVAADSTNLSVTGNLTLESWIKLSAISSGQTITGKWDETTANNDRSYRLWLDSSNRLNLSVSTDGSTVVTHTGTNTTFAANTWYHVTGVYNTAGTMDLYVNGILDATQKSSGVPASIDDNASNLYIGAKENTSGNNDTLFNGAIDDVHIYNYARIPKQIVSDMNAGHPTVGSPVGSAVGWWKFDEGYGTTARSSGNCAACSGTLTNSPAWKNEGKFDKALNFNGSTQSVTATLPADPGYSNTLSTWVYPVTSAASKTIITASKLTTDSSSRPNYGSCVGSTLPLMQWTHIVAVSNGSGSCVIYQNGVPTASSTTGITFGTSVNIGASSFSGMIDEVKIYNYALNTQEVKIEYNRGKAAVWGALSTNPDGSATNSAARAYCPPGNSEGNCAAGSDPSPVGEWKFDENTGLTANDSTGNANAGTLTNGPLWTRGKIGSALKFNGVDNFISIDNGVNEAILNITNAITIEAWINPSLISGKDRVIFRKTGVYYFQIDTTGVLEVYFYGTTSPGYHKMTSAIPLNTWTHVAVTYDGSKIRLYNNGVYESFNDTGSMVSNLQEITIGAETASGRQFAGVIDDVRVYNYARTPAQIAWDHNRGRPVGWWKFDECAGATAHDASNNSYNGAITIGATGNQTSAGNCSAPASSWGDGSVGKFNSSLALDGTDDYAATANTVLNAANSTTYQVVSWGDWILASSSAASKTTLHKNKEFKLTTDASSKAVCSVDVSAGAGFSATTAVSNTAVPVGSWAHVLCTYDGTNIRIYVNGRLETTSGSLSGSITSTNTTALSIGRDPAPSGYFQGLIDDVRVYNYSLTPSQVKLLYNGDSAVRFGPATGSP